MHQAHSPTLDRLRKTREKADSPKTNDLGPVVMAFAGSIEIAANIVLIIIKCLLFSLSEKTFNV